MQLSILVSLYPEASYIEIEDYFEKLELQCTAHRKISDRRKTAVFERRREISEVHEQKSVISTDAWLAEIWLDESLYAPPLTASKLWNHRATQITSAETKRFERYSCFHSRTSNLNGNI